VDEDAGEGDPEGVARAYVALGLRLGRVVPGLVDAHLVDARPDGHRLARAIDAEPVPDPEELRRDAAALRRRLARESSLGPDRAEFLDAQLGACEAIAGRAAGQERDVVAEVRDCLGVDVAPGDPDDYRRAHTHLADVLGTSAGGLGPALAAHRARDLVPPGMLRPALTALVAALRERTRAVLELPPGERVDLEIVDGAPWAGFARRVGPGRSVVQVSREAGHRRAHLALLAAHETYPGHHTEMARREATGGAPEQTLFLARTPQSLVAEGVAECGLDVVVGPGWGAWAAGLLSSAGVPTTTAEGALGEAVEEAMLPLAAVRQDAALLLHGSPGRVDREERALAHLRRWLLVDDARARRMLGFLAHPRWRIHTTTYVEGVRLVRPWLGDDRPAGCYARLLDEPWTPARLRRDLVTAGTGPATRRNAVPGDDGRYPPHDEDTPSSPIV
jgi:hypothetical protein